MGQVAVQKKLSEQEYLALERAGEERHEYADGEIFAMSGGTWEHSLIASNILRELGNLLLERRCSVHGADLRIHIPSTGRYTYADGLVVCGEPVFTDAVRDTITNPIVIVEVLSDSTEKYDRGDRFEQYETIPSFRDYLLVSQKKARIEHFHRQADGTWQRRVAGRVERVVLESIGCELAVDRAYLKAFEAGAREQADAPGRAGDPAEAPREQGKEPAAKRGTPAAKKGPGARTAGARRLAKKP